MEREQIYTKWLNTRIDGKVLCSEDTIRKCRLLSDYNFDLFVDYQNDFLKQGKSIKSYKSIRSKILEFLSSSKIREIKLDDITQEDIDEHLLGFINNESDNNYNNRVKHIKGYLEFHKNKLKNSIDLSSLLIDSKEITTSKKNIKSSLTAEQVALCEEKYKNNLTKLFIFKLLYYTDITTEEIIDLKYSDFDTLDNSFNIGERKIFVPNSMVELISSLRDEPILSRKFYIDHIVKNMKQELKEVGISNFKPKDMQKTHELLFLRCPQCGCKYEAVVDNWCARQFTDNGKFWIVCREKCGKDE